MPELTRTTILEMDAGPELDALVAERVMGWRYAATVPGGSPKFWQDPDRDFKSGMMTPKPYSNGIAAAWEVVEQLHGVERRYWEVCGWHDGDTDERTAMFGMNDPEHETVIASATTAPLAICRAALLATLQVKDDQPDDES